jgi:hypothetical protein
MNINVPSVQSALPSVITQDFERPAQFFKAKAHRDYVLTHTGLIRYAVSTARVTALLDNLLDEAIPLSIYVRGGEEFTGGEQIAAWLARVEEDEEVVAHVGERAYAAKRVGRDTWHLVSGQAGE